VAYPKRYVSSKNKERGRSGREERRREKLRSDSSSSNFMQVLMGIEKAIELYDFKYILKVDTDTWVTTPNIVKYLESFNNSNLYIGLVK
jgi:hypothetical protein